MANIRTILIELNNEIAEKLEVDGDTVIIIGDYRYKASELTGLMSYPKLKDGN